MPAPMPISPKKLVYAKSGVETDFETGIEAENKMIYNFDIQEDPTLLRTKTDNMDKVQDPYLIQQFLPTPVKYVIHDGYQ
jgi:hypothetical protein